MAFFVRVFGRMFCERVHVYLYSGQAYTSTMIHKARCWFQHAMACWCQYRAWFYIAVQSWRFVYCQNLGVQSLPQRPFVRGVGITNDVSGSIGRSSLFCYWWPKCGPFGDVDRIHCWRSGQYCWNSLLYAVDGKNMDFNRIRTGYLRKILWAQVFVDPWTMNHVVSRWWVVEGRAKAERPEKREFQFIEWPLMAIQ